MNIWFRDKTLTFIPIDSRAINIFLCVCFGLDLCLLLFCFLTPENVNYWVQPYEVAEGPVEVPEPIIYENNTRNYITIWLLLIILYILFFDYFCLNEAHNAKAHIIGTQYHVRFNDDIKLMFGLLNLIKMTLRIPIDFSICPYLLLDVLVYFHHKSQENHDRDKLKYGAGDPNARIASYFGQLFL